MSTMVEHHIQRDILARLARAEALRFSELKPSGVENNSFMYHIKNLISLGLVDQLSDKSYRLSKLGLAYIDGLTWTNKKPRKQPKILSIFGLHNKAGEYLLAQRLMQPTIGTWMLPSGKQHFGETSLDQAGREALQQFKTQLELTRRGTFEILIRHGDVLVTHIVSTVYSASYDGRPPADTEKFHYAWVNPNTDLPLTPGTADLIEALENNDTFSLSLDVNAD